MSDVTKVAETSRRGLEPVNPKLAGQYNQIIALLAQRLGPDHAFLFAEPMPLGGAAAGAADTAWYSKGTGTARPLSALPEDEATAVRAKLERLVGDIETLAAQLQNEGETARELGRLLRDALVLPDAQRVFVVDDRPVLVDWGSRTQAGTSVSALGHAGYLAAMGGAGRAGSGAGMAARLADPAAAPPPGERAGDGDGGRRSRGPAGIVPPAQRPRWSWLAHAALWIIFVVLAGATGARLLDACALGPTVWPSFVLNWLPGHCPALSSLPEIQAVNEQARALEAEIRQQEIAVAVKAAQCDCVPSPTIPAVNPAVVPPPPLVPPVVPPPVLPPPNPQPPVPIGPSPTPAPTPKDVDERLARLNVERGLVEVTLAWDGPADLDLHLTCPDRTREINFRQRTNCGGRLVLDMGVGGGAPDAHSIEHIVWTAQPPAGSYTAHAVLFNRYTETRSSISYTVVLRLNGKIIKEQSGQLATNGQNDAALTFNSPVTN